jgi:hypothetical protein
MLPQTVPPLLAQIIHKRCDVRVGLAGTTAADCFGGTLHLDAMLKECPNLSKLDISCNGAVIVISELQPDTLRHLQTLSVCISSMQFEILLQILRLALKLRSVFIDLPFPNVEELKQLAELAKEGSCMQHLEKITFRISTVRIGMMKIGTAENLDLMRPLPVLVFTAPG